MDKLVLNATQAQENFGLAQGWSKQEDEVNRAVNAAQITAGAVISPRLQSAVDDLTRSLVIDMPPLGEINLDHLPPAPGVHETKLLGAIVGAAEALVEEVQT